MAKDYASDSDSGSDDGTLMGMETKKNLFNFQSKLSGHAEEAEIDSSSEEEIEEEEPVILTKRERLTENGPMGDIFPYKGDPDGKFGFRCRICPEKVMQSTQDVLLHLQSKGHKKRFKRAFQESLNKEEKQRLIERKKRKRERRKPSEEERKEKKRKRKAKKLKSLSEEQIQARKEKRKRKSQRRQEKRAAKAK